MTDNTHSCIQLMLTEREHNRRLDFIFNTETYVALCKLKMKDVFSCIHNVMHAFTVRTPLHAMLIKCVPTVPQKVSQ